MQFSQPRLWKLFSGTLTCRKRESGKTHTYSTGAGADFGNYRDGFLPQTSYPKDKPYPNCLIYGENFRKGPVHSVLAYNRENSWAVVITVYRPDPKRWIKFKTRKTRQYPRLAYASKEYQKKLDLLPAP